MFTFSKEKKTKISYEDLSDAEETGKNYFILFIYS